MRESSSATADAIAFLHEEYMQLKQALHDENQSLKDRVTALESELRSRGTVLEKYTAALALDAILNAGTIDCISEPASASHDIKDASGHRPSVKEIVQGDNA